MKMICSMNYEQEKKKCNSWEVALGVLNIEGHNNYKLRIIVNDQAI